MKRKAWLGYATAGLSLLWLAGAAQAASLSASGRGDFNGDDILELEDIQSVSGSPVAQTNVDVSGFGTDFGLSYDYEASADIEAGTLAAYGQITAATDAQGREFGLLTASANFRDTLTFDSTLAGDYDITFLLGVAGFIQTDGGAVRGNSSLSISGDAFAGDFGSYTTDGAHTDTLVTTVTLNGDASLDVFASLVVTVTSVVAGGVTFGDFRGALGDDGASISIVVPGGVSLTGSDSGAVDWAVVPVPAGFWLLLSGVLCFLPRRRFF